jgi:hypothetical protein
MTSPSNQKLPTERRPRRLATVCWSTPAPTSVNEELAIYDDGSAWLAVRVPRDGGNAIGTFTGRPTREQAAELAGVGTIEVDLLAAGLPVGADVGDALAAALRENSYAAVAFSAASRSDADGVAQVGLYAVATGVAALPFELEVPRCAVHFLAHGREVGWTDLPELPTGFVTADAEGRGGIGRPADIRPGSYGAIGLAVPVPAGADEFQLQVAGRILLDLPDGAPAGFEVRTPPATITMASS